MASSAAWRRWHGAVDIRCQRIGDGAWLLNRDRTVVLRAGGRTAKVTLGGSAARSVPPEVVTRLAAAVAERLPDQTTPPGMQA